jgi:hypothetical protein
MLATFAGVMGMVLALSSMYLFYMAITAAGAGYKGVKKSK